MPQSHLRIAIEKEIPDLSVSASVPDLLGYARDTWPLMQIRLQQQRFSGVPGAVVRPTDADQVARLYRFASAREFEVTPVGAGSGVCGGATPSDNGIVMDLKGITEPLEIYGEDGVAEAGVGWLGQNLEDELNKAGFTAGHFPSSIMCSTLGGWLAARGAGQLSTQYGKFEDRVRGLQWVFPDGTVEWLDVSGHGDGALELLMGSEGTLGVATRARFRIDPVAESRRFRAWMFNGVEQGLNAIRTLLHHGIAPAVVRLYDPFDTFLAKSLKSGGAADKEADGLGARLKRRLLRRGERVVLGNPGWLQRLGERFGTDAELVLMFEGPAEFTEWQARAADELLEGTGRALGEAPGRAWFEHRYDVSFRQSAIYSEGGFADTMEVAFPWSRVMEGYRAVREALIGDVLLLAHFSHVYEHGASIYFTFSAHRGSARNNEALYRDVWRRGMEAVLRSGGTITHHHGVGLLKARWMADEWGDAYTWLRTLKTAMDPERVANPGKLGL